MKMASTDTACAVGLDVGGTKMAGGLISFPSGRILVSRTVPTCPERGGDSVLDDAVSLVEELMSKAGSNFLGIGVGVAELVDLEGQVTSSHTIAWQNLPVQQRFSELSSTLVDADVRMAALGEACFGAGRAFDLFAFVAIGTGIGYCLVQDTQPYSGARGNALILASSPLSTTCTACGTRLQPVLEAFASGPAMVARFQQAGGKAERGEDVFAAADAGNPDAMHVLRTAGEALGVQVGFLVNVLDPEALVIGGGLGMAKGPYWECFLTFAREHIWSGASRELPILKAGLGNQAGVVGAAAAIWKRQNVRP